MAKKDKPMYHVRVSGHENRPRKQVVKYLKDVKKDLVKVQPDVDWIVSCDDIEIIRIR